MREATTTITTVLYVWKIAITHLYGLVLNFLIFDIVF